MTETKAEVWEMIQPYCHNGHALERPWSLTRPHDGAVLVRCGVCSLVEYASFWKRQPYWWVPTSRYLEQPYVTPYGSGWRLDD